MPTLSHPLPTAAALTILLLHSTTSFQLSCLTRPISTRVTNLQSIIQDPLTVSSGANIKYPTLRGSEVDSRKIVSEPLLALRVGHVLFAGEELAGQVSSQC